MEAHLLKSRLESEGIPCFLFDEHLVNMNPLYSVAVGGIKLKIQEADKEKTLEILREIEGGHNLDENGEILKCPECDSARLYLNFKSMKGTKGFLSAITSFLFMVFPVYFKTVHKCKDCGAEFRG
ncbi:putative signal transducing protein [Anseongella ginsenosidimutans]|uniref:Putative signal transducing protein n=1 Tax=Anseongella ginsenosidimutans TaxID=496056 RepID=A0A4R3KU45_9SPHI|nr:DUF2007 domain-containing protein [Anseongella ginsenosidimutans]QEC51563.1 DUF2007 domain-containing protein [Anseongella ginsenosidimutans]TCS88889.1 putative signal transducing protein [Anseongella ginsenosidimutans]